MKNMYLWSRLLEIILETKNVRYSSLKWAENLKNKSFGDANQIMYQWL
jgi:hypothetical protein